MFKKVLTFRTAEPAHVYSISQKIELLKNIPQVQSVQLMTLTDMDDTYALFIDFESKEAHETYLVEPQHVEFAQKWFRPFAIGTKTVFFNSLTEA